MFKKKRKKLNPLLNICPQPSSINHTEPFTCYNNIWKINNNPRSRTIALYCMDYCGVLEPGWNTQAGSFTYSHVQLCALQGFLLQWKKKKSNTGRQFLADSGEKKLGAPRLFFFFLPLSLFFLSSFLFGSHFFWTALLGLVQRSWTGSRRGWVFGAGLVSAFTFTVCRTAAPPLAAAASIKQHGASTHSHSGGAFLNKSLFNPACAQSMLQ